MAKPQLSSAKTWSDRYDLAANTQERQFHKFAAWYDLMYAHVNTSQYALWRSKVFVPIIPSKAWAMVAKMTSLKPGFEVGLYGEALNDPNAQENADKAQWKLEHDWDNPLFDEPMNDKLFSPLVDAVVTGTGIAKLPWCFTNNTRYEKYRDDATGEVDITKDIKIETAAGYNELVPHDIMSTFVAPGSKTLQSASWVILEDWPTYEQLVAENEAADGQLYDKQALETVKTMKADADRFAREKQSRDTLVQQQDPVTADQTVRRFKRLECYEKSTMYLYVYAVGEVEGGQGEDGAAKFVELSKRRLPYWHGKYPLVSFYVKKRPHSFWGQGVFEDTERLQSAFNDVFNHYMDNLNLSLDGMIMKQAGEEFSYIVQPGGEFLYNTTEPKQFKFPEPNPNQFNVIMNFIESQVEEATISRYATGTPNSQTDTTKGTATGILKLTEMAGDKIGFFKQNFQSALREIGRQWLSNNQQFMDAPFTLMGEKNNRPHPMTINPGDLQGQFVLRINDASMEPMSKDEQLAQFEAYINQALAMQKASVEQAMLTKWAVPPMFLDFAGLFRDLTYKFGQNNFDKVVLAADEVEQKIGQNPGNAWLTPNQRITYNLDDLFGTEAAQLLGRDGIQPDPRRQQQVPVSNDADPIRDPGEATSGPDPVQATNDAAKNLIEAHRVGLQADQQQFEQQKTAAELGLKAHQQQFDQVHQAVQLAHTVQQAQQSHELAKKGLMQRVRDRVTGKSKANNGQ